MPLLVVALLSPIVMAPSCLSLVATELDLRHSPPTGVCSNTNTGAVDWFDRWLRPICCTALSALHGSSRVMWTRWRWFFTRRSAWSEMPVEAASLMMATSFSPAMNRFFSVMLSASVAPASFALSVRLHLPPWRTSRHFLPVISATIKDPPSWWMSSSSGLMGRRSVSTRSMNASWASASSSDHLLIKFKSCCFAVDAPAPFDSSSDAGPSPVDCSPTTTHFPSCNAFFAMRTVAGILPAISICSQNRWAVAHSCDFDTFATFGRTCGASMAWRAAGISRSQNATAAS
mmetsp:Transcript_45285/g.92434  ORF Transcript_45285/g.92434 Transcript_45285/m.92434 type:complete len:288 (+) Transcript_45285:1918-2781(+)